MRPPQVNSDQETPPPVAEPIILRGTGNRATGKVDLPCGLAMINYSVKNNHDSGDLDPTNFGVELYDSDGNEVSLVENEIVKEISGSQAVQIPLSGSYVLNIKAAGSWEIVISQGAAVRPAALTMSQEPAPSDSATSTEKDPATTIDKMLQAGRNNDQQSLSESISYLEQ